MSGACRTWTSEVGREGGGWDPGSQARGMRITQLSLRTRGLDATLLTIRNRELKFSTFTKHRCVMFQSRWFPNPAVLIRWSMRRGHTTNTHYAYELAG